MFCVAMLFISSRRNECLNQNTKSSTGIVGPLLSPDLPKTYKCNCMLAVICVVQAEGPSAGWYPKPGARPSNVELLVSKSGCMFGQTQGRGRVGLRPKHPKPRAEGVSAFGQTPKTQRFLIAGRRRISLGCSPKTSGRQLDN